MSDGGVIALVIASISALAGVAAAVVAWVKLSRQKTKTDNEQGQSSGTLISDVGYIKAGVDDLKRDNREMRKDFSDLSERVTRVEESAKQAHKRIDEIKKET